jgi:outer membrane receptor protein involved in Fe transport
MRRTILTVRSFLLPLILLTLWAASAQAQTVTGGIRGIVVDASGAVVPSASIVARNLATNLEYRTASGSEGVYQVPRLPPGKYILTVAMPLFRKVEYAGLDVRIGTDIVVDIRLEPGAPSETITVVAAQASAVQADSVQISASFDDRKIESLPINTPSGGLDRIALLIPGVVPGLGSSNGNGTTLSVNGNRDRSNNFTIDGVDNNDLSVGGPSYFVVNPAAVAEFQVITNNFSAEYGRNQGAIINIVSRAGSNAFHGSVSWAHRDRKNWDSLTNLERRSGQTDPAPDLLNVFGYGIGGPIIKDRAFFYTSAQLYRNPGTADLRATSLAPTPEGIQALKSAFPNNPAIQYYADYSAFALTLGNPTIRPDVPASTITVGSLTIPVAAPRRVLARLDNRQEYTVRADGRASAKDKVWGRWFFQDAPFRNSLLDVTGWSGDAPTRSQQAGGGWVRTLGIRSLNEFRFNYSRLYTLFGGGTEGGKGQIPHPDEIDKAMTLLSFPGFTAANGASLLSVGPAASLPQGRTVEVFQFTDSVALTAGRHQVKFGADIRRLRNRGTFLPNVNGAFSISDGARLAANNPNSLTLALGPATLEYPETDQFYFLQDDWRVRQNLTLNLGIRYENSGQPVNLLNDITSARENDPVNAFWRQDVPLAGRVVPRIPTDGNNWAPRVGFVYSPRRDQGGMLARLLGRDKTVISGGFGIAYDPTFYNMMLNMSTAAPMVFLTTTVLPVPDAAPTGEKVRTAAAAAGGIARNTYDPRLLALTTMGGNFHAPYSEQWSLRWQREIARNNVLEIRYVGTHGVGLFQTVNANPNVGNLINGFSRNVRLESASGELRTIKFAGFTQLLPAGTAPLTCVDNPATADNEAACNGRLLPYGIVRERNNSARSIYQGLQMRFDARFAEQLFAGFTYSWSHAIDNSSEVYSYAGGNSVAVAQNPLDVIRAERGNSGYDARHVITAHWMWELPWLRGRRGVIGQVLGGWQVNGIVRLQTALPFTPRQRQTNRNPYEDNAYMIGFFGSNSHFRPFNGNASQAPGRVAITDVDACVFYALCGVAAGVPILRQSPTGFWLMNGLNATPVSFTAVTPNDVRLIINGPGAAQKFGTPFGDVGRNTFLGDRIESADLSVFKKFRVTEGTSIQYRLDLFNAFNHPNFGIPNSTYLDQAGRTFFNFQENDGGRRAISMSLLIAF